MLGHALEKWVEGWLKTLTLCGYMGQWEGGFKQKGHSMLRVKTYLALSPIHKIGLYAAERIPEGTTIASWVWQVDQAINIFRMDTLRELNPCFFDFVRQYGYFDEATKAWRVPFDNLRFMNHSDTPNTESSESSALHEDYANRIIEEGEELTCNYWTFDGDAERKLGRKQHG